MTIPVGVIFEKVYEIWNLTGLRGGKTMEAAVLIALAVEGICALYFVITYRIACSHVLCCGGENRRISLDSTIVAGATMMLSSKPTDLEEPPC